MVRQYSQFMALMNNYDYFKENVGVAEQSTGTLEQQAEIYAESWEAAQKRVRAAAEGVYQDLIDDKFFISLNNGLADIISGLDNFIDKAGGLKTIIMALSGVILANFSNKIPEAIDKARYNFDVLTKGSDKAYQKILTQMNSVTEDQFKKYDTYQDAKNKGKDTSKLEKGINRDSAFGVELKQANQLTALKLRYAGVEDKLSDAEKQRYQTELNIIEAQQKQQLALTQQTETLRQNVELKKQALLDTDVNEVALGKYSDQSSINQLENLSTHNEGGQYNTLISDTRDFLQFLDVANNDIAEQYNTMNRTMLEALTDPDIDTKSFKLFTDDMSSNFFDQIAKMSDTLGDLEGAEQAGAAINTVRNNLRSLSSLIPQTIQQATGLDKAFRQVNIAMASGNVDEIQEALSNLMESFDKATINGENFETVLQSLHGKSVTELKEMFLDLGLSEEQAEENAKTLKASVDSLNPQHVITVSEAFGNLASGVMSAYAIINSTKSVIASLNDEDLSAWEKFGTIISGIMVIGPNLASLGKSVKAVGTFATGAIPALGALSGKLGTLVTSITGVGAATGATIATLGIGALIIAAVGLAIWGIVSAVKAFQEASPEGQLKKVSAAAEEAKTAAEDAANAYDNLKSTIDSYDSCIEKLEDLEVGTQAFRDALEDANEKAWELIRTYDLVKGKSEDWYIGDKGEVVITDKGKEKATSQAYENKLSAQAVQRSLELATSKQEVVVAESKLSPLYADAGKWTKSIDQIINTFMKEGTLSQIQEDYKRAKKNGQDYDFLEEWAEKQFGNQLLDSNDPTHDLQLGDIRSILENMDKWIAYKEANDQYQRNKESYGGQNVSEMLASNSAYQDSAYKNEIYDKVLNNYDKILKGYKDTWDKETDSTVIADEFEKVLGSQYLVKDNGDVVDRETGEINQAYSELNDDQKKDVIIAQKALAEADQQATEYANSIETAIGDLDDGAKGTLDSLTKGLDGLSKEAIQEMKDSGKEISIEDLFGDKIGKDDTLYTIVQGLIDQLNEQIKNYNPADFDLETWQSDYEQQMTAAGKISDKGIIKDADFEEFRPELQEFFTDLQNGTHVLTISADEFNQKIRELSQQDLKQSLKDSAYAINKGVEAYGNAMGREATLDEVDRTARTMLGDPNLYSEDTTAYQGMLAATGIDVSNLETTEERVKAVAQAWLELTGNFENGKTALAASMGSIKDLEAALANGEISVKSYDKAFNAVLAADAQANGFDYSEIEDYAEALMELNKKLEDNEQLAKKIALAEKKQSKAVEDLGKNYEDYAEVLAEANENQNVKNTEKYSKAIQSLRQDMSLLTGLEEDAFSDEFINSKDTQQALADIANGVDGAVEKFRLMATMNQLQVKFKADEGDLSNLYGQIEALNAQNIEIGTTINDAPALDALAELLNQTGATADQMQAIFNALGWDPEIEYVPVDANTATALRSMGYQQYATLNADGSYNVQPIPLSGEQTLAAGSQIYVPKIKTKAMGGGNYKKIDVPTPTLGNKKSSGGGGGGGGKKSHADTKSFSDKERYHTIKNQIEDLNSAYDDLNKAKDRAFGKDRLKYMDSEISKTQELIDAQEEYLRQIRANLPTDKSIMEEAYNSYIGGPGIEYDESGNISNFDEIQDAMFEEYNRMAQKYTDDSDEWKIFEKKYELLEKYIEQYEETYDLARDEQSKLQELQNQKVDLQLEQVQYEVEIKLDIPDSQIKVLEYKLGRIDDDAFKALDAIELMSQKADNLKQQIAINKQGLNDVLALTMSAAEISQILAGNLEVLNGKSLTDDQISAIKEYRDNLLDLNSQFDDLRKEIEDKVMSAFDAWKEKLDKGIASIDHYNTVLDDYKNIIDIVGKDTLGITDAFMTNLAQRTTDNAINKLRSVKSEYETIVKARDEASSKLADAEARKDQASIDFWQQTLDTINEEVESSNEEMMQAWQDALESLATQFENTMNNLIDTFNKSVYALGGLDGLSEDFSRQQEKADIMLDDYQKIYELSKLSRDINKTIDDTDIISGKQKLKKLLGQINDLQEDGNEMSKYDLEYLQKTYDLRLAEIELEEAQRAKNTVRLQKDNEGNWSYIYTQSSDAIDSAQQKYEDALYAMQDLSSNYIDEMSEKLISTSKEMQEAIAAIRIQDYASIDDYYAAVKRVQDQYEEEMNMQQNELQKAIDNNKELYNIDWQNYHDTTGYKISDLENFATTFKDTLLGTLLDSESDTANFTDILKNSVDGLTEGLLEASRQYYLNLEEAMNAAGTSTKQFATDASEAINQVISDSDAGTEAVKKMSEEMKTAFDDITDSVNSWQESYGMSMEKIIQANLDIIESFNNMLEALSIDPSDLEVTYNVAKKMDSDAKEPDSFDSGGYTGNWGSFGRLAMLHQKELVLNETDTANMLAAVQITRAMLDTIDLNARQASFGFGDLVASGIHDNKSQTLQQEVKITAEFPNVQDHNEIEQAFNNLINQASQYANRK